MSTVKINYLDVKADLPEVKQFIKDKYLSLPPDEKLIWKKIADLLAGAENMELEIVAKDQFIAATIDHWRRAQDEAGVTQTQLMSMQQLHTEILKKSREPKVVDDFM